MDLLRLDLELPTIKRCLQEDLASHFDSLKEQVACEADKILTTEYVMNIVNAEILKQSQIVIQEQVKKHYRYGSVIVSDIEKAVNDVLEKNGLTRGE